MYSYGTPGGALKKSSGWTTKDRAAQGRAGEKACAELIHRAFRNDPDVYVLHDLSVPGGYSANVDHVIVKGFHILLVDAKRWKPGFYWTRKATTRRGREAAPHADKKTLPAAARLLRERIEDRAARSHPTLKPHLPGLRIDTATVVFPSNDSGRLNLTFYRPAGGGHAIADGKNAAKALAKILATDGSPAPVGPILAELHALLPDQVNATAHGAPTAA